MANPIPDVPFPLFGHGATAVVKDRLPLRLLALAGCTIHDAWNGSDMTAPTWRIYLDLDDGAEAWVRGRCTPLIAGHLFVLPAWLRWSSRCQGRVRHCNAMVDLPSLPRERVVEICRNVVAVAGLDDPLVQAWLGLAVALAGCARPDPALVAQGHALVWAAMSRYFALLGPAAEDLLPPERDSGLTPLLEWTQERLDQPLPRAALARQAGCSEAELARRFAQDLGTSPARWIRQRRVALAAELLRASDMSIDHIAVRCGLVDRTRLSKVFRQMCGCGPAAFRRRER